MLNAETEKNAKYIGGHIRTWRKLLGLTARQVAERAGVSLVTFSKFENGYAGISFGIVLNIFRAVGILNKITEAADPYESDLGRARADIVLPKRVRR